jgi:molecular chaperone DnaK (HSP70)
VRISLEFSLDASGVVHLNARSADARETIKCALKAPSGLEPEEVEKFTAQHRSRRLIRLVDVQRAEATDHLGRLIGMLERQVANSAEADTARLARLIERGRFLLDKGQEEEQLRMIRWLTKRLNISSDEIPTTNLDNAATAPSFLAAD